MSSQPGTPPAWRYGSSSEAGAGRWVGGSYGAPGGGWGSHLSISGSWLRRSQTRKTAALSEATAVSSPTSPPSSSGGTCLGSPPSCSSRRRINLGRGQQGEGGAPPAAPRVGEPLDSPPEQGAPDPHDAGDALRAWGGGGHRGGNRERPETPAPPGPPPKAKQVSSPTTPHTHG